jgi:YVTN family beta-propeller protein
MLENQKIKDDNLVNNLLWSTNMYLRSLALSALIVFFPASLQALKLKKVIEGNIAPKSVVHSGGGLFFAQNMMYRHSVTVYNRDFKLVKTISDRIKLSDFGFRGKNTPLRGAPVEVAFTRDKKYAYVSNYQMHGKGYNKPGHDKCSPKENNDLSFVYRIPTDTLKIDQVIKVGSVPKYLASTPDGKYILVSNWCTYDVSVIDIEKGEEIRRIKVGRFPRGIEVSPDSSTAYVAVMGSYNLAKINLRNFKVSYIKDVGRSPRHLNLSPDGQILYATLNGEGLVAKIDVKTEQVLKKVSTGHAPRSMQISKDGKSLYVVNYRSNTISKVTTGDMKVVASADTKPKPIGITFDDQTGQVWVSCYSGVIMVFQD